MKKRILASILTVVMLMTILPIAASADTVLTLTSIAASGSKGSYITATFDNDYSTLQKVAQTGVFVNNSQLNYNSNYSYISYANPGDCIVSGKTIQFYSSSLSEGENTVTFKHPEGGECVSVRLNMSKTGDSRSGYTYTVEQIGSGENGGEGGNENEGGEGSDLSESGTDAGKTISPGSSATIKVGETLTLQGTKPSSYGNHHYWYTDEEDVDYIEWDIDNNASSYYYAGTNICNVTGIAAGMVKVYHQYIENGSWTNPGETFTINVIAKNDDPEDPDPEDPTPTEPEAPAHVKSISGAGENYVISLNVTGKDITGSTSSSGQDTISAEGTNLVMVVDISASIIGKEDALNNAIKTLVNSLPNSSQIGIVTFNESASTSQVLDKSTVSQLSFEGVENAGTNMATGISAAQSLLNGSGWSNKSNNKAMVIISDFDADDYADSINTAKTAKGGGNGTTIYCVKIDSDTVGEASLTELTSDKKQASIAPFTRYVSSEYPNASAVNNSMFGMFNQASVTVGEKKADGKTYVYGAANENWSGIFGEITQSENMVKSEPAHVKNVVITDTLSDYVELQNTEEAQKYGVTVDGLSDSNYSVTVSDKKITVTFDKDYELEENKTYTVNIPVKPTQTAIDELLRTDEGEKNFNSNIGASLSYSYGDSEVKTVEYTENPEITLHSYFVGHSLTLSGDIGLNFCVYLTKEEKTRNVEVKFTRDIPETTYEYEKETIVKNVTSMDYDSENNCYIVPCSVNAAEMTCDIFAELYIDGVKQTETDTYSVKQYADTVLSKKYQETYYVNDAESYNKLYDLVMKMLDYGAKAQTKFGRNTDNLANAGLMQSDRSTPYSMNEDVTSSTINEFIKNQSGNNSTRSDMTAGLDNYGLEYIGSSVVYLSKHTLRHYYVVKDEDKFNKVKDGITFDGQKCGPTNKENDSGVTLIYFEYSNVSAENMGKRLSLRIGSSEYSYSVLDYSAVVLELGKTGADAELAKAAYHYAVSAASYYAQ